MACPACVSRGAVADDISAGAATETTGAGRGRCRLRAAEMGGGVRLPAEVGDVFDDVVEAHRSPRRAVALLVGGAGKGL
ncbi:hypothetical protein GCM10018962_05560 [Dactylosporangium matsuzakiense]|uniref:Uncharacterized protein n=1 Tax=Dactylosporangium matsuzakiense TaxID=53360 RepID=A0A9W6NT86_9ACTN|nr:hypothetical protein GCM10017581_099010 [Dactylosporangium matsuzakiense]